MKAEISSDNVVSVERLLAQAEIEELGNQRGRLTVGNLVEEVYGLERRELWDKYNIEFDYAIPEPWLRDLLEKTGVDRHVGMFFIWMYDGAHHFGRPFPLSVEAKQALEQYEALVF